MTSPDNFADAQVEAELDLSQIEREFGPRLEAAIQRATRSIEQSFTRLETKIEQSSERIAKRIGDGYADGARRAVAAIRVLNQQQITAQVKVDGAKFRREVRDLQRGAQAFLRTKPLNLLVQVNRDSVDRLLNEHLGATVNVTVDEGKLKDSVRQARWTAQEWLDLNPLAVDIKIRGEEQFNAALARLTRTRTQIIRIERVGGDDGGGGNGRRGGSLGGGDDGGSFLGTGAKIAALAAAVGALGGAVGVAGGAIGVLVGGLAAMGPAAGAALTSLVVGFKGLADGAKAFNEQFKEQDEALAKAIGQMMGPMLTAWHDVSSQIKLGFARDLQPTFQNMGNLINAIGPQLQQVAGAAAGVINQMTSALASPTMTAQLQTITASAADLIKGVAPGLGQLMKGFIDLGTAAAPMMQSIGAGIGSIFGQLGKVFDTFADSEDFQTLLASFQPTLEGLGAVIAQLMQSFLDLGVAIGPTLGPLFQSLAQGLANLTPGFGQLGAALSTGLAAVLPTVGTALGSLANALTPLISGLSSVVLVVGQVVTAFAPLVEGLASALAPVLQGLSAAIAPLVPIIQQIGTTLAPVLSQIGETLGAAFAALAPSVQVLGQAFSSLAPVIGQVATVFAQVLGQVIGAIGPVIAQVATALAPAIASLAPIFTTLAPIIGQVAALLAGVLGQAITALAPIVTTVLTTVGEMLKELAPTISTILTLLGDAFGQIISALGPVLLDTVKALMPAFTAVAQALGQVLQALTPIIPIGVELVKSVIEALAPILPQIAMAFADLVKAIAPLLPSLVELAMQVLPVLATFITEVLVPALGWLLQRFGDLITFVVGTVLPAIVDFVRSVVDRFNDFIDGVKGVWHWTEDSFNKVVDFVRGLPDKISNAASGMWDGIKNAFKGAINWIIQAWNSLEFKIPGFELGPVKYGGFTLGVPDIPMLAGGGVVGAAGGARINNGRISGPGTGTSDSILALIAGGGALAVSNGESVNTEKATRSNWWLYERLNAGVPLAKALGIPGLAGGGTVGSGANITSSDQQNAWDTIRQVFPGLTLTSATRTNQTEGHPDNHNAGVAIDLSGDATTMRQAAEWIAQNFPGSRELIHQGIAHNIKNGENVGDGVSFYGAGQMAAHGDHVHWAPPAGIAAGAVESGVGAGATTVGGDTSGGLGLGSGTGSAFSSADAAAKGGVTPVWVENWPTGGAGTSSRSSSSSTPAAARTSSSATPAAAKTTGQAGQKTIPLVQNADGKWTSSDPEWAKLIDRESGGDATITQQISDVNSANGDPATGLFQITGGTWKRYGGAQYAASAKDATPEQQAEIAAKIFEANNGRDWGVGLSGRESADALRAGLAGGKATPGGSTAVPAIQPAMKPLSSTPVSATPVTNTTTTPQAAEVNPIAQAAGFGQPTNKSWFEAVGSDLPSQVLGWGGDALKEVGGEVFDLVGLGGLFGKGVDFGVNAGKAGIESGKKAAQAAIQAGSAGAGAIPGPGGVVAGAAAQAGQAAVTPLANTVIFQGQTTQQVASGVQRGLQADLAPVRETYR